MAKVNYVIDQGRTFSSVVQLNDTSGNPIVVTGYSASGSMRKHAGASSCTMITCTLSNGQMVVSLTANTTSQLADGRYIYDIALTDPANNIVTLLEGLITVKPMAYHWWPDANAATYSANVANNAW